ncbi:hypothetical protein ACU8V7_16330 [Zobellia nedashkovskayae]
MKTMTCKQLGGACDMEFSANTFEEIADLSKNHGMEMFQKKRFRPSKSNGRDAKSYEVSKWNAGLV